MPAITDIAVTGSKLLTPAGDLVTLDYIRLETIGTTLKIYGARNKNIVGGDAISEPDDTADKGFMSETNTQLVSVTGGLTMSHADALLLEAALDTLLSA